MYKPQSWDFFMYETSANQRIHHVKKPEEKAYDQASADPEKTSDQVYNAHS